MTLLLVVALVGLNFEAKVCRALFSSPPLLPFSFLPFPSVLPSSSPPPIFPFFPYPAPPSLLPDFFPPQLQVVLLIILLVAILDFLVGTFISRGTGSEAKDRGFTGYNRE